MVYRDWSLLSWMLAVWGGIATAGLGGVFLLHGKEKLQRHLSRESESLQPQDTAAMNSANRAKTSWEVGTGNR